MLYKDVSGVFEWGALQGSEALTDPPSLFPLPSLSQIMAERRNARCLVNGLSLDHSKLVDVPFQGQCHSPTRSVSVLLAKLRGPERRHEFLGRVIVKWRLST